MYAFAVLFCALFRQCDPVQEAKLLAADGSEYDLFGSAVALDQDTALIGARQGGPNFEGAAYVFERRQGQWQSTARLAAPDAAADDRFGYALAVSGDWIAVGAPNDDERGPFSGSVYLFQRQGGAWSFVGKAIAHDGSADDAFGAAVALAGDTLVVGAVGADPRGYASGAAYVFQHNGSAWVPTAKLSASDGEALDSFGFSVAVCGDTIVVGAYGEDALASNAGAAYVFQDAAGPWIETAKLTAPGGGEGDFFGQSVAAAPGVLVVGAPLYDGPHLINGAAYVFEDRGFGWQAAASLQPFGPLRGDRFGLFVAATPGAVAVATTSRAPAGAVFYFEPVAGRWTQTAELRAADALGFESFGEGLALAGTEVLTGAPADDDLGPLSGSAYLFQVPSRAQCPRLTVLGPCPGTAACVVENLVPGAGAALFAGLERRAFVLPSGCSGVVLDLHPPFAGGGPLLLADRDGDGAVRATAYLPPAACGRLRIQALDASTCGKSNLFDL